MLSHGNTVVFIAILIFSSLPANCASLLSSINPKSNSTLTNQASNIDSNIRLLTVLGLQQSRWELYGNYWYRLFEVDLMWIPAENFCRSMGGHLASITNEAENYFIHKLRKKNNIWIGLNKIDNPYQVYRWSDGTSATFLNWDSTQPNEPEVDCVYMAYHQEQRGTWFDYGCHEMLPQYFVCKLLTP